MKALGRKQEKLFRQLTPRTARLVTVNGEREIQAEQIWIGDVLRIMPGETVPADGRIFSGDAALNQAVMTGSAEPVKKRVGDEVPSGTINCGEAFDLEVIRKAEDSYWQRTVRLVLLAEREKNQGGPVFRRSRHKEARPAF